MRPLTAVADTSSMYRCSFAGSVGNPMPVVRISSPPCTRAATPGARSRGPTAPAWRAAPRPRGRAAAASRAPGTGGHPQGGSWPPTYGAVVTLAASGPAHVGGNGLQVERTPSLRRSLAGAARWSRLRKPPVTLREDESCSPYGAFLVDFARGRAACLDVSDPSTGSVVATARATDIDDVSAAANWGGPGHLPDDVCHRRHLGRLGLGQRPHPDRLGNAPQWLQVVRLRKEMSTCSLRAHPRQVRHVPPHRCHRKGLAPHDLPR